VQAPWFIWDVEMRFGLLKGALLFPPWGEVKSWCSGTNITRWWERSETNMTWKKTYIHIRFMHSNRHWNLGTACSQSISKSVQHG